MNKSNEPFTSELIDDQIELLGVDRSRNPQAPSPEHKLIQDMRDLYREYADTRDRVRRRLEEHMESSRKAEQPVAGTIPSLLPERQRRERAYHKQSQSNSRLKSRLALVAATLCAALLVVSLIIIQPFIRSNHTNPATAKPSVTSVGGKAPGGIYIANATGVLRIDPATGATLKSYPWLSKTPFTGGTVDPYALWTDGKLLYVGAEISDSSGSLHDSVVQALDPSTSTVLWTQTFSGVSGEFGSGMVLENGTVYVDVGEIAEPYGTTVFALRASDGKQLKSYHLVASTQLFSVANGFLYIIGYAPGSQGQAGDIGFPLGADLYGVNLTTGATWHQSSQPYHSAVFTAFHVLDGVLYASLYYTNQANGDTTSFLMAFSASSGVKQWQSQAIPGKTHAFTIAHNVIYFGTDAPLTATTCGCKDRFDAYDIGQHKVLWQQQTNGVATSTAVKDGIVYAVTSDLNAGRGYQPEIIALSADQGKLQWSTPVDLAGLPSPLVVEAGKIDFSSGYQGQGSNGRLHEFAQTSGKQLWSKDFPAYDGTAFLVVG